MRAQPSSSYAPMNLILISLCGGLVACCSSFYLPTRPPAETTVVRPLPHHFPKYPDGVTLRFAMVHDVIHERFPVHGRAYYEERNRVVSEALEKDRARRGPDIAPGPEYFALLDDLGVGLERLGRHKDAVDLMRDKLAAQKKLGLRGRDLYGSYANLGTFLILWQLADGFDDKALAKERIRESIDLIHKAVEVYPESHFGREVWQAVLEEFLLEMLDDPGLALRFDMVGNRLGDERIPGRMRCLNDPRRWIEESAILAAAERRSTPNGRVMKELIENARRNILRVGAEYDTREPMKMGYITSVPFDEPTLGIIGIWRYGAGANPHFALALGEIMMRVGQRYIAWCAYERAADLGKGIGPEYVEHCRRRQRVIEGELPAAEVAQLRPRFNDELEHGRHYQQEYQDYEARKIKEGASIDDPHFYDAFLTEKGEIASAVGEADTFVVAPSGGSRVVELAPLYRLSFLLLGAGLTAFPVALLRYRRAKAASRTTNEMAHDGDAVGQDD